MFLIKGSEIKENMQVYFGSWSEWMEYGYCGGEEKLNYFMVVNNL